MPAIHAILLAAQRRVPIAAAVEAAEILRPAVIRAAVHVAKDAAPEAPHLAHVELMHGVLPGAHVLQECRRAALAALFARVARLQALEANLMRAAHCVVLGTAAKEADMDRLAAGCNQPRARARSSVLPPSWAFATSICWLPAMAATRVPP